MVDSTLRPPALAKDYVFAVSGSSFIDTPPETVWDALLGFGSYKYWNPFVRNQVITDAKKNPLTDQTPGVGKHTYIYPVHLPPTLNDTSVGILGKNSAFCVITALDHENFQVAWNTTGIPTWILWSERWQWLTQVETDLNDGKGRRKVTRYDSMEIFGGFAAYLVKWFVGSKLKLGFQAQAGGLKWWAERSS